MTRVISATNITSSEAEKVRMVLLAKLEFDSATLYLNNTVGTYTFDGNDYLGIGSFGSISKVQEGAELRSYSMDLTLSGVDSTLISEALSTGYKNRDATIYLGYLDSNYAFVADPFVLFKGRMDTMPIEIAEESTITLTVEGRLADWERSRISRYTDADQKQQFSTDKGLEFVDQMVEKTLIWGRS